MPTVAGSHFQDRFVTRIATGILGITEPFDPALHSDSLSLGILICSVLLTALVVSVLYTFFSKKPVTDRPFSLLLVFSRYYLASALLIYGLNKILGDQFYQPEPNILYTRVGNIPRDLLYWTAIGASPAYSAFMGALEVAAAILLLFRKTARAGALAAFAIMLNVTAVNFSFDISVKVLSLYLLTLSLILLAGRRLIAQPAVPDFPGTFFRAMKWGLVVWIVRDAVYPYLDRPPTATSSLTMSGAWEVNTFIHNGDTLSTDGPDRWRRFYFHSKGWFITEHRNDSMADFSCTIDTLQQTITLDRRQDTAMVTLLYDNRGGLHLYGWWTDKDSISVQATRLEDTALSLFRKEFRFLEQ